MPADPSPPLEPAVLAAAALLKGILAKVSRGGLSALSPEERTHFDTALGKTPIAGASAPASQSPGFRLLPARARLSADDRLRLCTLYGKEPGNWRTLYSWIQLGEKNADPTPIQDPVAMLEWWPRNHTWRIDPAIVAAADEQKRNAPPITEAPVVENSTPPATGTSPAGPATPIPPSPSIDFASLDPDEGDRFRELKQLQAARWKELAHAIEHRQPTQSLESAYTRLCDTIDKMETRITERAKSRGLYLLRTEVENDVAGACEMNAQFRASMETRVLELCPSLTGEQRREVAAAILRTRAHEDTILARLPCLSADDLLKELHTQAA